jgi:hypothetical protein
VISSLFLVVLQLQAHPLSYGHSIYIIKRGLKYNQQIPGLLAFTAQAFTSDTLSTSLAILVLQELDQIPLCLFSFGNGRQADLLLQTLIPQTMLRWLQSPLDTLLAL